MPYTPKDIEPKWQRAWAHARVAEIDVAAAGEKFYMLNMFPYPSGDLHVGHGRNYILGDALYRFFRMRGRMALNPMGWDAFGLPAENAAIKRRIHPREWTLGNIARNPRVGLLFIAFDGRSSRIRINGRATVHRDAKSLERHCGAKAVIRVECEDIYPNCPRYIPNLAAVEPSIYLPRQGVKPPAPEWKIFPTINPLLPADDVHRERS